MATVNAETLEAIFVELANGNSLRAICRDLGLAESTVRLHIVSDETASAQYVRARELQADAIFEEILEIADGRSDDVQRDRLAVDARKWMAGKLNGKYSDKIKHVGGDPDDAPVQIEQVGWNVRDT